MNDRRGHASAPVAALLALLVAALVTACSPAPTATPVGSTTGPSTGPVTAVPTTQPPTAAPATLPPASTAANAPACTAADLKASHGLVEGAAGSRLTEVVLVAGTACSVEAFPTLGLRDAGGAALVGGVASGSGRIDLSPDAAYSTQVRVANWCSPDPAFPVVIEVRLGDEAVPVTGGSFPEEGNLPPCNGDGAPILEADAWVLAQ